jgi:hypothetical protein
MVVVATQVADLPLIDIAVSNQGKRQSDKPHREDARRITLLKDCGEKQLARKKIPKPGLGGNVVPTGSRNVSSTGREPTVTKGCYDT